MSDESKFFKEMARKDLLSFSVYCDRNFEIENHHKLIAEHLEKVLKGEIQNLIIEMPPRAGKSRIMQEFIAKVYGDNPDTDILYTGHSLNLLEGFSRNIRNRINSLEYKSLYSTRVSQESSAVKNWNIEKGGEFAIYGVGGGITGKGGDILIIDDPYSSRQDAESDTVQRTVSDWYWSTLITRKQDDKSKQIIIMQRWKEDDLVGEILEREGSKWTELKIPALNDNDESFWPTRFSSDYFKEIRASNPLFFSSQYQQDPVNKGGGDFRSEYFTYCDNLEIEARQSRMDIVTFVDPAISQKQEADFTAIVTIGTDSVSNNVYLLECKQLKAEPGEIINEIFATSDKYKNAGRSYRLGIETIQYQKMLFLEVQNQMRMRDKYFTLEDVKPTGEKNARIRSILQPRYSSRSIIHPKDLNGLGALELELLKFPNGKHDDMIDAMSSALSIAQVNNTRKQAIITPNYI